MLQWEASSLKGHWRFWGYSWNDPNWGENQTGIILFKHFLRTWPIFPSPRQTKPTAKVESQGWRTCHLSNRQTNAEMSMQIIRHVHQGILLCRYSYLGWNEPALRAAYGESRWAFCLFCRKKKNLSNSITFHIHNQFVLLISVLGEFYSPEFFQYLNNNADGAKYI